MSDWIETGAGNQILVRDGFTLSYNPDCSNPLFSCSIYDLVLGLNQTKETAIVWKDKFFILNGDHRKEYEHRESIEECLAFFLNNEALHSPTSDEFEV